MQKATYIGFIRRGVPRTLKAHTLAHAVKLFRQRYNRRVPHFIMLITRCPACKVEVHWNKKDYPINVITCPGCREKYRCCTAYERRHCEACHDRLECLGIS